MGDTIELVMDEGVYRRAEMSSNYPLRYFTVYCQFPGDETFGGISEEIDVMARDSTDAQIIASVALANDYEPGGHVVESIEREKGWIFGDL